MRTLRDALFGPGAESRAQLGFAERLKDALGPVEVTIPELNPVPRQEAIRFVNGLPRTHRDLPWFEAPPPVPDRDRRLARLVHRLGQQSSPALRPLRELLEARQKEQHGLAQARMKTNRGI